mmetsp:Transcript_13986/g.19448  ORF Transcript_13986/g.19448 Transcript_13986/m.19448 type:complete len:176 (-) Transcript_13986:40-567(-)
MDMNSSTYFNPQTSPIKFYRQNDDYGYFSNFSAHPITINGKEYQTTEHYFQSQKFVGTEYEDIVIKAASPGESAKLGRNRSFPLRKDWEDVKDEIMYTALIAKFTQHKDLQQHLLGTGDALLIEHTTNDRYWADGGDGSGKNMLGILLMKLRHELTQGTISKDGQKQESAQSNQN